MPSFNPKEKEHIIIGINEILILPPLGRLTKGINSLMISSTTLSEHNTEIITILLVLFIKNSL